MDGLFMHGFSGLVPCVILNQTRSDGLKWLYRPEDSYTGVYEITLIKATLISGCYDART